MKPKEIFDKLNPIIDRFTPSYRTVEAVKYSLVILGIAGAVGGFIYLFGTEALKAHDRAYNNLVQFSRANNLTAGTCNQWDTDNDGKISCTATDKQERFIQLECASNWFGENTGSCNLPKPRIQSTSPSSSN
jgi:hypothetical protein